MALPYSNLTINIYNNFLLILNTKINPQNGELQKVNYLKYIYSFS